MTSIFGMWNSETRIGARKWVGQLELNQKAAVCT
jgi:hypothetical protein